jgi:hypothetical protein
MVKAHNWRSYGLAGLLLGGLVALLASFLFQSRKRRRRTDWARVL